MLDGEGGRCFGPLSKSVGGGGRSKDQRDEREWLKWNVFLFLHECCCALDEFVVVLEFGGDCIVEGLFLLDVFGL